MPRLGGRELADLARGLYPQMRILCISGDAGDAGTTDEFPVTATALLHKPFTIEELTGKIREALERSPG
jgi:two-component system cell cycle response regulator CpdR